MTTPRMTLHNTEPDPNGDVTLVPQQLSGQSEAELARVMADAVAQSKPASQSEALKVLRTLFPSAPLSARVAALGTLIRH